MWVYFWSFSNPALINNCILVVFFFFFPGKKLPSPSWNWVGDYQSCTGRSWLKKTKTKTKKEKPFIVSYVVWWEVFGLQLQLYVSKCCSSMADGISRAGTLIESGSQEFHLLPDADITGSWFRVGIPIHGLWIHGLECQKRSFCSAAQLLRTWYSSSNYTTAKRKGNTVCLLLPAIPIYMHKDHISHSSQWTETVFRHFHLVSSIDISHPRLLLHTGHLARAGRNAFEHQDVFHPYSNMYYESRCKQIVPAAGTKQPHNCMTVLNGNYVCILGCFSFPEERNVQMAEHFGRWIYFLILFCKFY